MTAVLGNVTETEMEVDKHKVAHIQEAEDSQTSAKGDLPPNFCRYINFNMALPIFQTVSHQLNCCKSIKTNIDRLHLNVHAR